MSNENERTSGKNPNFRIINGGRNTSFEKKLSKEIFPMDEEEGIITDEQFQKEVSQRMMDNIPQTPYDEIELRIRHRILGFFKRRGLV